MQKKDNLTDLVEYLPQVDISNDTDDSGDQQVIDSEGDLITLGHKPATKLPISTYGELHELIQGEVKEVIRVTIERELKKGAEMLIQEIQKTIRNRDSA